MVLEPLKQVGLKLVVAPNARFVTHFHYRLVGRSESSEVSYSDVYEARLKRKLVDCDVLFLKRRCLEMALLNQYLTFASLDSSVRRAFEGGRANRITLEKGRELYKFSGLGIIPDRGNFDGNRAKTISPWWACVDPIRDDDPGLDGHIKNAKNEGSTMASYAREAFAVMYCWNSMELCQLGMAKVLRIVLAQDAFAFVGKCSPQKERFSQKGRSDNLPPQQIVGHLPQSPRAAPTFSGGAVQVYIPNLSAECYQELGVYLIQ
jgi:hypothetical protein